MMMASNINKGLIICDKCKQIITWGHTVFLNDGYQLQHTCCKHPDLLKQLVDNESIGG